MTLDTAWTIRWLTQAADDIEVRAPELSELDRAIGDGDHGENMNRGFAAVRSVLAESGTDATPSDVLRTTAMRLISSVGGAAGPLYGTAFLRAADAVAGKDVLDSADVVALLDAALGGIEERGHAAPGDKTMVDAWSAAVADARGAASAGADPAAVLAAAASGGERGASATDALLPHKGRASYLGERAVGHRDPGAASTVILLQAAAEAAVA
ncbi:dihydroxyacetone kinase subunit L [Planctomonas sp. JC2975]|uniref:dihydroxyacetone kinase subunit DhaL n=1 Tax=Planctomonas sp. JC2975 TaxID=2729626 RepID=UPI0014737650|nr:dihydroxyacetone kinase subunit DhaL [Planctomonas sp. JC2975]NNC10435.1 dihydroxyacetone kinase subunit L [Planctomonas sp. JC2975]